MNKLIIKNLKKSYEKIVLNGIDLEIDTSKITVLLGKSGCGKTTLLRLIAGLETKDEGEIIFNTTYSMVFQEPRLFPWLNVGQNICFEDPKKIKDKLPDILKMIQLEGYQSYYPIQLSGGMKQRVAIGRALIHQPEYILMDEPFSALDYFTRLDLQQKILELYHQQHIGMLFVTHNVEEALQIANRILVIKKGRIGLDISLKEDQQRDIYTETYHQIRKKILEKI